LDESIEFWIRGCVFGVVPSPLDCKISDQVADFLDDFLVKPFSFVVAVMGRVLNFAQLAFEEAVELHEAPEPTPVLLRDPIRELVHLQRDDPLPPKW